MSAWFPVGSALEDGSVNARAGAGTTAVSQGVGCSIDAAQQAHVHRTQNAGQPLSGADSIVPIGQVSGTRSELTPLASAMSTASTAMKNARRMPAQYISWCRATLHATARAHAGRQPHRAPPVGQDLFDERTPAVHLHSAPASGRSPHRPARAPRFSSASSPRCCARTPSSSPRFRSRTDPTSCWTRPGRRRSSRPSIGR